MIWVSKRSKSSPFFSQSQTETAKGEQSKSRIYSLFVRRHSLENRVLFVLNFLSYSSLEEVQLKVTERDVGEEGESKGELIGNITTTLANLDGKRASEPSLDHTKTPTNNTDEESSETSETDGKSRGSVPAIEIVVGEISLAEPVVFNKDDDEVRSTPITKKREEVLQVFEQVIATSNGNGSDGTKDDKNPESTRNLGQRTSELLNRQSARVEVESVHADGTENEQDKNELGETAREEHLLDEVTETIIGVGIEPILVDLHGGSNTAAKDHTNTGGDADTKSAEDENLDLGGVDGVVDVVIGGDGGPGARTTVDNGEQGEDVSGKVGTMKLSIHDVDSMRSGHTVHDHENDEEDQPGVLLVVENGFETAEVDDTATESNDDATKSGRDFAIRYSSKSET